MAIIMMWPSINKLHKLEGCTYLIMESQKKMNACHSVLWVFVPDPAYQLIASEPQMVLVGANAPYSEHRQYGDIFKLMEEFTNGLDLKALFLKELCLWMMEGRSGRLTC
jgi:hypothetical protein